MAAEQPADVSHSIAQVDMINATSKLQIEAAEVRSAANKPNWSSYLRSQLIPQEEYNFVTAYENCKTKQERDELLEADPGLAAKCFISLITDVAKDQLIRYVLTLLDDLLQEEKSRSELFHAYARRQKRTIWSWFQGLLTRQDNFIANQVGLLGFLFRLPFWVYQLPLLQTASVFAKFACFGTERMEGRELSYYFNILKDGVKNAVSSFLTLFSS